MIYVRDKFKPTMKLCQRIHTLFLVSQIQYFSKRVNELMCQSALC